VKIQAASLPEASIDFQPEEGVLMVLEITALTVVEMDLAVEVFAVEVAVVEVVEAAEVAKENKKKNLSSSI
jgi:hypothetical protein